MIAYYPLEELNPPIRQQEPVVKSKTEVIGREETELNYVIMAFIISVILLAVSDSMRA